MDGLQRSSVSFRRQGSSGLVWDDKLLSSAAELDRRDQKRDNKREQERKDDASEVSKPSRTPGPINAPDRSRSNGGGRGFRTGKVSPAIEPPSPRVSACGLCGAFGNRDKTSRRPNSAAKLRHR